MSIDETTDWIEIPSVDVLARLRLRLRAEVKRSENLERLILEMWRHITRQLDWAYADEEDFTFELIRERYSNSPPHWPADPKDRISWVAGRLDDALVRIGDIVSLRPDHQVLERAKEREWEDIHAASVEALEYLAAHPPAGREHDVEDDFPIVPTPSWSAAPTITIDGPLPDEAG